MNKTSKEDFKYFQEQCQINIDQLGLRDFKIYYNHDNSHISAYAWITPDVENGIASIGLTINWELAKVTKEQLRYVARHEVLHLLLADLVAVGNLRQSTTEDFTRAQHAIIRRLENWDQ